MSEEYDLCAALHTTRSKRQIARLFRPPTWQARKCSWADYEITSAFAELIIEAESPILLHGWVTNFEAISEHILIPLQALGVAYTAECYSAEGDLLREFTWGSPNLVQKRSWPAAALSALFRFLNRLAG